MLVASLSEWVKEPENCSCPSVLLWKRYLAAFDSGNENAFLERLKMITRLENVGKFKTLLN